MDSDEPEGMAPPGQWGNKRPVFIYLFIYLGGVVMVMPAPWEGGWVPGQDLNGLLSEMKAPEEESLMEADGQGTTAPESA